MVFFWFILYTLWCGYILEAPLGGVSNDYIKLHMCLAHPSLWFTSELIVWVGSVVVVSSVNIFKHLLLWNHWADWSQIPGIEELMFIQMNQVTLPWWPPWQYMVKTFQILLLWNLKADCLETWYVALETWAHQSLFKWWLGWPWPILRQGQIWSLMLLYGEKVENNFSKTIVLW